MENHTKEKLQNNREPLLFTPQEIAGELSRQYVSGLKEQSPYLLYLAVANVNATGAKYIKADVIQDCGLNLSNYKERILSIGEFYIKRKLLSNNWEIILNEVVYSLLSDLQEK